jgi:antitoxin ParD1/3/4
VCHANSLTPEQEAWLRTQYSAFDAASLETAARKIIDDRIAESELETDDLAWAKPLVDEGVAAIERGEFITLEEFKTRNAARLAALKD